MSLNNTPSSERLHIGIFGRTNSGKSSLINALTGQNLAIVSDVKGTTTDPVSKAMELLPLGPVVLIDTPGLDDDGILGMQRIEKAEKVLKEVDMALLVIDINSRLSNFDIHILNFIKDRNIPYITVFNKADMVSNPKNAADKLIPSTEHSIYVSCNTRENIDALKEMIGRLVPESKKETFIVADLVDKGDLVVLVVPIDESAPKGRLILPQQQTIRELLDKGALTVVVKDTELEETLNKLGTKPKLVITDSQVFKKVAEIVPEDIYITSFSILFARYKGDLNILVNGAETLDTLEDKDTLLISEGCTHHRQCNDIGTVKLPGMLKKYTGKDLNFEFTSGKDFPDDLSKYKLIVHCGGCTLTATQMKERIKIAKDKNVPITNYGVSMAKLQGILDRNLQIFSYV